jgi:glycosyltransferase involved in cell wall biosynthesis
MYAYIYKYIAMLQIENFGLAYNEPNILYYVDSSSRSFNTGLQRVTRLLGRYLDTMCNIYLVKFNRQTNQFVDVTVNERKLVEKFNGIPFKVKPLDMNAKNKWLFNAEISFDFPPLEPLFNEAKRNNIKIALIYYDDIPYKMDYMWPAGTKQRYKLFIKQITRADLIIPISNYSYGRLRYHINDIKSVNLSIKTKIVVCPLANEFPEVPRCYHYNPPFDGKYRMLCIGLINVRKNQIRLLQAVDILKGKYNIEVTLVGPLVPSDKHYKSVLNLMKSNPNIIHYDGVDDSKLKQLYSDSHLTVFPSIEEGYGLPIVESIWNCRPCICMNEGAMAEAAIAGCVKVDCNDPNQIAGAIDKIILNEKFRNKLIDEIKKANLKTWQQFANEILNQIISF